MIDRATRARVRERAAGRCEYCRVREEHVELPHHVEHILPRKHGGPDDPDNLALACERCNLFKGSDPAGVDPADGTVRRLFHPRLQGWHEHFELRGARIVGRTPVGSATVATLSMNAAPRLQLRAGLIAAGLYP